MPQNAATTRAQMADRTQNPIRTTGDTTKVGSPGLVIHVDFVFQGVAFKPEDLFDALEAKYGAGKVTNDTDSAGRPPYRLRIVP